MLRREVEQSDLWLVAEYEADAFGDPSEDAARTKQELAKHRLRQAILALWIARPTRLSYRLMIDQYEREGEWLAQHMESPCLSFVALDRYRDARIARSNIESSREILRGLAAIPTSGVMWIASRGLYSALQETDPALRFLIHWIGLEALFGSPDVAQGIGSLIAARAGAFLAIPDSPGERRGDITRILIESYEHRNAIAHGLRTAGLPDPENLILPVEGAIRGSLHKILTDTSLIATFNGDSRDAFLDEGRNPASA
jgi:hypothetical protein